MVWVIPFCSPVSGGIELIVVATPVAELNWWLGTQKWSGVNRSAQTRQVHIKSPRIHLYTPPNPTCSRWYYHEWLKADYKPDSAQPPSTHSTVSRGNLDQDTICSPHDQILIRQCRNPSLKRHRLPVLGQHFFLFFVLRPLQPNKNWSNIKLKYQLSSFYFQWRDLFSQKVRNGELFL